MQAEVLVHRPVLAEESPRLLVTDPNGVYVDGTFGRGGHSRLILEKLSPQGRLIAFDRDEEAVKAAAQIQDPRFQIIHAPFASLLVQNFIGRLSCLAILYFFGRS